MVIGTIRAPKSAFNINYDGSCTLCITDTLVANVFLGGNVPAKIVAGESQFVLICTDTNDPNRTMTVSSVHDYSLEFQHGTYIIKRLELSGTIDTHTGTVTIEPVITKIIPHENMLAIIFNCAITDNTKSYITTKYNHINHMGKVYHLVDMWLSAVHAPCNLEDKPYKEGSIGYVIVKYSTIIPHSGTVYNELQEFITNLKNGGQLV